MALLLFFVTLPTIQTTQGMLKYKQFLAMASIAFEIIPTPVDEVPDESKIRDVKDRPILRAAQLTNVDILLTGDKDFLESGVTNPKIIDPSFFINQK